MRALMDWLPSPPKDWQERLGAQAPEADPASVFEGLWALSRYRLDLLQSISLHRRLRAAFQSHGRPADGFASLRVAILASSTVDQLPPAVELAAFRRRMLLEIYTGAYGQYRQEILEPKSALHAFKPDAVLLALDAAAAAPRHRFPASPAEAAAEVQARIGEWSGLWDVLAEKGYTVLQQNLVVPPESMFGHLDPRVPGTLRYWYGALNQALSSSAQARGVLLFDAEALASQVGKDRWLDHPMWHHAKQPFAPELTPLVADHLARLLGALRGLSKKCLVLDLDNTLWGGVVGDDGIENLELGQGTGVGEAHVAFQTHLRRLKARGILLAVCSKNDEAVARDAVEKHPEMVLRMDDFAAFIANWRDKAANLRQIAADLRLGLESFVFFDDNPVERHLIRQALPAVEVPEVPGDPALFASCLADAGYFEAVSFTPDDARRGAQYAANRRREPPPAAAQDLDSFLKSLQLTMTVAPFDDVSRPRVAQLINRSNQFNLTTRRYTERQVELMQRDRDILTFQVRLEDAFGDHGLISVLILKPLPAEAGRGRGLLIDTWLMSCRVLGLQVEQEVLNAVVREVKRRGCEYLRGEYLPTPKNGLVRDHYRKLGFLPRPDAPASGNGGSAWDLPISAYQPVPTFIRCSVGEGALQDS